MTRAELPERIETERLVLRVQYSGDAEDIYAFTLVSQKFLPSKLSTRQDLGR